MWEKEKMGMRVERAERELSKALDCNFSRHIRDGNSNEEN